MMHVKAVFTKDSGKDITALLNRQKYPLVLLALCIAESSLHEKAVRERTGCDFSYGLVQQSVCWIPDGPAAAAGMQGPKVAGKWPVTEHNKQACRAYFSIAQNALADGGPRMDALMDYWDDPVEALCRWNKPSIPASQNANRPNYERAWASAQAYLADEDHLDPVEPAEPTPEPVEPPAPEPDPGGTMPVYLFGFKDYTDQRPEYGKPLTDEDDLGDDPILSRYRFQVTEGGLLTYSKDANTVQGHRNGKQIVVPTPPAPSVKVDWYGSPNYYGGRPAGAPVALVIHTMAGSLSSCDNWFRNPASQVSSHYGIGLNGEIHQYVKLTDSSWANGVLESGNLWSGTFGSTNPNYRTVTIETADNGSAATPVTDAMYNATLAACRIALAQYPSIKTLCRHTDISPRSRPGCPGNRWTNSRFKALAATLGLRTLF